MYKKYGVSKESSNIIPETMEKAYKMLQRESNMPHLMAQSDFAPMVS